MNYKMLLLMTGLSLSLPVFADNAVFESCTSSEEVSLDAVVKWHWQGSSVLPSYNQVMSTPIVVPLEDTNGDGEVDENDVPSVVFNTFTGGNYRGNGVLRAISGKDGSDLWTVTDPAYRVYPGSDIAAADLDKDGLVEIVAPKNSGGIIAFENTGQYKWHSSHTTHYTYTGVHIADLDADNSPEIIIGNVVYNADGSLKWQHNGYNGRRYSVVADLNLDDKPEVILGASAHSNTGELLWRNTTVGDGFTAIGNFDTDNYPEIVVVRGGRVSLLSHEGELIWGPTAIPGGGSGGPPTVADMDADNQAEIGVAGAYNYVVFDTDGQILWTAPTRDGSSSVTGSSVFDFDGDGQADVVYNDELYLRIYRGIDGKELFKTSNTSGTLYEMPLIVDVDNNNHADIVVASNSYAFGVQTGIIAFQGKDDNWMNTRKIWNQHAYSITNINDDGSVPAIPEPSWLKNNTFRSIPYLSKSGKTCISPATCQLYATQDTDINDTQFFTVSIEEPTANIAQDLGDATLNYQINPLGGLHAGHDIEAIAIHPKTDIIYVVSGNNTAGDLPKGFLYGLDAETGKLLPVGATGFRDVGDLAFSPSGILYGYAKGKGIITIDLDTGAGELWIPATQMVEGLALAKIADQTVFYGSVDQDLWTFDADSGELDIRCDNLLGETEALEMLTDSLLIFTTHHGYPYSIHFIDVQTCEILPELQVSLAEFDDVEGLALPMAACR